MGHIYCNKAAGGQRKHDLERNLARTAPPKGLILPDSFIARFYDDGPARRIGLLIVNSRLALMEVGEKKRKREAEVSHRRVFMVTGAPQC